MISIKYRSIERYSTYPMLSIILCVVVFCAITDSSQLMLVNFPNILFIFQEWVGQTN